MNLKKESLDNSKIINLLLFLKKINYPQEELKIALNLELNKSKSVKKVEIENLTKIEDLIKLAIQSTDLDWLITQISSDIFETYEKIVSKGQVKAILKRVLKLPLSNPERTQLSELRKKIRRYEKFLTYFGEWGKDPDQLFKVIIHGLSDEQSSNLPNILLRPKVSGERSTIGVDFYTKTLESYDKSLIRLQFWNISGDKRFEFLREHYYKGASAIIIIYEKGNRNSIELAKRYYSEFKNATNLKFKIKKLKKFLIDTPVILVGLGDKPVIPLEGGPILANEIGAHYFDKNQISADEFDDIFNLVSLELLVKCQNQL